MEDSTPKFTLGDRANVLSVDGEETVVVFSEEQNGTYSVVRIDEDGTCIDPYRKEIEASRLMRLRGPFFDIRGQVLTTSSTNPNEVGEVVSTGTSKSGKTFFKVKFSDGKCEWFNEDQVFIEDSFKAQP